MNDQAAQHHYGAPGWFTRNVFNRAVAFLTRHGVSVWGSRELHVRGRKSGEWRSVPVNLLTFGDEHYLVAPRGHTQWVRNLRVAGQGELRVGRHIEAFQATEVADADKDAVLRAYLAKWKMEVGVFFDGVSADSPDEELARIAPSHPVFLVETLPRRPDPTSRTSGWGQKSSGVGSRSSNTGSRFSALAVNDSIMSVGWNMPVCQVAM